jgi:hypothetical protein
MILRFTVSFPDDPERGDVVVEATPRDQLKWEKGGDDRNFSNLLTRQRLSDIYSLAYHVMKRKGLYNGMHSQFEDEADVEVGAKNKPSRDDSDEHPTQSALSTED